MAITIKLHAGFLGQFPNPNLFWCVVLLVKIIGLALPASRFAPRCDQPLTLQAVPW